MFDQLVEVIEAVKNNRFEIVLKNVDLSSEEDYGEANQGPVFQQIPQLNLLSITSCSLPSLSSKIELCSNLISLVLPKNKLKTIPDVFESFPKLKMLDISNNEFSSLPSSISKLEKLESLIVGNNNLSETGIPDLSNLSMLHIFDGSHNKFTSIPVSLMGETLSSKLHTIDLSHNEIEQVPDDLMNLKQLKDLKLNNNKLKPTPYSIGQLPKIKFLDLSENVFKDTRFKKMANDKRSKVPSLIAYIVKNTSPTKSENNKSVPEKEENSLEQESEDQENSITIHSGNDQFIVKRHSSVVDIRPYIVCCVFRNCDLNSDAFKKFITLQTKLHASPLCDNRTICAIGTHRLESFELPLCYMALPKEDLYIRALNKKSSVNAQELLDSLLRDAELARKRCKRSTIDPLHKYLHLVKDDQVLACLVDDKKIVISLPPITNSDLTKLTVDTTNIWVEVSSKQSLEACKTVMDELVMSSKLFFPQLELQQVRVVDNEVLVSVYPDKNDLSKMNVKRV